MRAEASHVRARSCRAPGRNSPRSLPTSARCSHSRSCSPKKPNTPSSSASCRPRRGRRRGCASGPCGSACGSKVRNDALAFGVAGAAGLGQVGRVDARARVGGRQVVVRRVAVRADRRLDVVERGGLAVEAVVERLVHLRVAVAAAVGDLAAHDGRVGALDRMRLVAGRAHRTVAVLRVGCPAGRRRPSSTARRARSPATRAGSPVWHLPQVSGILA